MGYRHKNNRPEYGDGGSMLFRANELKKIVHTFKDSSLSDQ